jgi:hypothetical protein
MEFVEGESPQGALPLDQALKIAHQVADALEACARIEGSRAPKLYANHSAQSIKIARKIKPM